MLKNSSRSTGDETTLTEDCCQLFSFIDYFFIFDL